jgi:hypothetical protein
VGGIYSTTDKRNPFISFHWIYVPYCTGDVHIGEGSHKKYSFDGRSNLRLMLARAVATFPEIDTLVVTGESAGGFGAAASYDFIRSSWPDAKHGAMVDDSGPILDDEALAPCLQEKWRRWWDLNGTLPPGCPCIGAKGNLVLAWKFVLDKYPSDRFGLISSTHDSVISTFFSFGNHDCLDPAPSRYDKLEAGLRRLSSTLPIYLIPGSVHTHTGGKASFYTETVNGTYLYQWVTQLVDSTLSNPRSVL